MSWSKKGILYEPAVDRVPSWLHPVVEATREVSAERLTSFLPLAGKGRHSAVLILFGDQQDILLIKRASDSSVHSGQPAFPGGAVEEIDSSVAATALREAREETGLEESGVLPFGQLPDLWIPVSDYVVTPVLAWWHSPSAIHAANEFEVASVHRVGIAELVKPENRVRVQHPSGYVGDAFTVDQLLVWGFTGGLLSTLLDLAGWSEPWDTERVVPL